MPGVVWIMVMPLSIRNLEAFTWFIYGKRCNYRIARCDCTQNFESDGSSIITVLGVGQIICDLVEYELPPTSQVSKVAHVRACNK